MAQVVASLTALIGADTKGFEAGAKSVKGGLSSLKSEFNKMIPSGISQFASLSGVVVGLGSALKFSLDNAAEAERVNAKLNAVLASTGGAAGLAADELDDMATSLSKVSIYDDEAIKSSEALLLTFTKIGRDVFPEAQQAILDMSTALGQDLQSSTIQLGKALNDPIAGVTALSKVGVSFTKEQKDMIKAMVEGGDAIGAQKLILRELTTEFGGQALAASKTYTGQMILLKNEFGNMSEEIGTELLPALVDMSKAMRTNMDDFKEFRKEESDFTEFMNYPISTIIKWTFGIDENAEALEGAASAASGAVPYIDGVADALGDSVDPTKDAEDALKSYEDQLKATSQANQDMESMSRTIAEDQKQYSKDHLDAIRELGAAQIDLKDAQKIGDEDKIADATENLKEQENAVRELEATWHESANNMIYDMVLVGLSAGGLLDSEQKALDEYAVKAGIKTQADIDEAERRREIADSTIEGILQSEDVLAEQRKVDAETLRLQNATTSAESINASQNEAAAIAQVSLYTQRETDNQALLAAKAKITAAAYASIKYPGGSSGGSGANPAAVVVQAGHIGGRDGGGMGHATGGDFLIPMSYGNEGFRMGNGDTASGGEVISITPKGKNGGGVTYNITINNPKRETSEQSMRDAMKKIAYTGAAQ